MRKQTIVGFVRKGWNIQLEDFGMIDLPLANVKKIRGKSDRVKITIEHCPDKGEEGVIIENTM